MPSVEQIKPYEQVLVLFHNTGAYVGGADGLFKLMGTNINCMDCKARDLIRAYEILKRSM